VARNSSRIVLMKIIGPPVFIGETFLAVCLLVKGVGMER
jgi:hypothetical protein